MDIRAEILDDD